MATTTLRPNATLEVSSAGSSTATGAASRHAAVSDNSDTSYVTVKGSLAYMRLGLGDLSLPAGSVIRGLTVRARYQAINAPTLPYVPLVLRSNIAGLNAIIPYPQTLSIVDVTMATITQSVPVADINAAYLEIANSYRGASLSENLIYEVYLDVIHTGPPSVDVTGPTGTLTEANRPSAQWTATLDASGGAQTHYQVKVFTAAQYGAGGFDPASSTALLDSGIRFGAAGAWQFTGAVPNGTYRSYVRIAQTVNNAQLWSAYDYAEYAIDVDAPAAPDIEAAPDDENARVEITLTANTGDATTDYFEVERSSNDGITWQPVRTAGPIENPTPTVYDYEAPNGGQLIYRARALHDYSGSLVASAWAQTETDSWIATEWWLKHPGQPALNMRIRVRSFPEIQRAGRVGVFQPLGSSYAVAISDTRGPVAGTITLRLDSLAEQAALDALLDTADTLLLISPPEEGAPGYIRVGDHTRQRVADRAPATRTFDALQFTVVAAPTGNAAE